MDADFWAGIIGFIICAGVGGFCLFACYATRHKPKMTRGSLTTMAVFGVVFLIAGTVMLVSLTLTSRNQQTLVVDAKYEVEGTNKNPTHYYLRTDHGTYQAARFVYDSLHVTGMYRCSVLGTYTGKPGLAEVQANIESCQPAQ